jgi:hypothetical protein
MNEETEKELRAILVRLQRLFYEGIHDTTELLADLRNYRESTHAIEFEAELSDEEALNFVSPADQEKAFKIPKNVPLKIRVEILK